MDTESKFSVRKFLTDISGATLVEYGVALLVVIVVGSVSLVGLATAVTEEITETSSAF